MFTPGNLLYFKDYYFEDGSSKPKYFLVLSSIDDDVILHTLPTSVDKVPNNWQLVEGCNNKNDECVSFYYFPAKKVIIDACGFSFHLDTYLLGEAIKKGSISRLNNIYSIPKDIQVIGNLNIDIFNELIKCFIQSDAVSNKYRRIFKAQGSNTL